MGIWSASRIREWDEYTIQHEPVTPIALMERAALACVNWILNSPYADEPFQIFCGKGNNGGDGLAIARLLSREGKTVHVYIVEHGRPGTACFQENLAALHQETVRLSYISNASLIPPAPQQGVIIDALFGTGLNNAPAALEAQLIENINAWGLPVISIDLPSGLFADNSSLGNAVVRATHTLSFQCWKLAFLLPESGEAAGNVHILDIGLHPDFPKFMEPEFTASTPERVQSLTKPRSRFTHKGSFGHAALVCGQKGMMGAALLSCKACLRTGAGKVTGIIPAAGLDIIQSAVPEALTFTSGTDTVAFFPDDLNRFHAMAIGPGIGTGELQSNALKQLLETYRGKLVLDADALNLLAATPTLQEKIPPGTILTPHPAEWERLAGKPANDFEQIRSVMQWAATKRCIVVLKGHHTFITDGHSARYFNFTGNNGLAKAGTGDVLTGMITAFLAQGYHPLDAALLGVYYHGAAADHAVASQAPASLLASDLIGAIGQVLPFA